MSSCSRHLKTLQFLPQSKCRLRWYLLDFISTHFFCLAPSWCDLRKSILLLCTLNVTIIFLFEVDTIIWFSRSKYCYNFFSESDYVPLYGFKRKNYMIQWSAIYHTINMFYTKSVKHNRIVYDQLIVNWFRISAMFFNGCQTLYEKNCNWRTSNILVFTLCLNVFMFW